MKRRVLFAAAGAALWPASQAQSQGQDVPALLRTGSCVVMLRHALTEAGVGDPPNFRLDQCATQRNLSKEGRDQAHQIGQWFKTHRLVPRAVQSSIWCRCKDTAELAFGNYNVLPALGSTFNDRGGAGSQTQALRALLKAVPKGQFDVWVTHQVNISALTKEGPAMGEAFILGVNGETLARTRFA